MTAASIQLFVMVALVPLVLSMWRREEVIQLPYLAAAVMLGWVTPQFVALAGMAGLPDGALDKTILFSAMCLAGIYAGYWLNDRPSTLVDVRLDLDRLLVAAAGLAVAGSYSFYKISLLAAEANELYGGMWSGAITIYVLLSSMLTVGFVVAIVVHIARPNWMSLAIVLYGLAFFLHRIVVQGRRAAMAELSLIALLAVWYRFRRAPPAVVVLPMLFVGALVVNSIGEYRDVMLDREAGIGWTGAGIADVLAIDWIGNMVTQARDPDRAQELLNAVLSIAATDRTMRFDFGASLWDAIVFSYVPAQIFGSEFKNALMFGYPDLALEVFGHVPWPGTTQTGMTDAYLSWWYFGVLKFVLIGFIMSRLWHAAERAMPVGRILLMLLVVPALHAITHTTHWFFVAMITNLVFLTPALIYARRPAVRVAVPVVLDGGRGGATGAA
jgi:hypothetical protein